MSTLPIANNAESINRERRLKKRRSDPLFKEHLRIIRTRLSHGQTLNEIRESLGKITDHWWLDLVHVVGTVFSRPEAIMLEWSVRHQSRYMFAADIMRRAKEDKDMDAECKALMMMIKIDENFLEVQKALGILRPVTDPNSLGQGISSEDISLAEQRFAAAIEQRISNKLTIEREAQHAQSIDLLPGIESGGETDRLDEAPLADNSTDGSIKGHQDKESISSGGFDTVSNQIILDVENKGMS